MSGDASLSLSSASSGSSSSRLMPPGGTLISSPSRRMWLTLSGSLSSPTRPASPENEAIVTSGGTSVRCLCRSTSPRPESLGLGRSETVRVSSCTSLSKRSPRAFTRRCLMRGSTAMGSDNRTSRMTAATPAMAVRLRRESATAPVTQLSGRPLLRGSLREGAQLDAVRALPAMTGAAGRLRSHVWHPPTHYGHPARAAPMRSAIVPTPAMEPSISSPGFTGPTPSGVPVKITSPGCR